jgi:methyl-accepting chemotaxis protein
VARTSVTLLSVGAEVRDTEAIVVELKGMSTRIAKFAQTIARIGRQTHLLALNAAIEAARSDAAGQGFAVVAEEVRALAAQAGRSARDVAELVGDLQAGIDAAAKAMASGGAQVAGIDAAAREADHALRELEEGVQRTAERALQTAGDGREQTARLDDLARILARLAEQTHAAVATAATGAAGAAGQLRAMGELGATAQRLVELTERLGPDAALRKGG